MSTHIQAVPDVDELAFSVVVVVVGLTVVVLASAGVTVTAGAVADGEPAVVAVVLGRACVVDVGVDALVVAEAPLSLELVVGTADEIVDFTEPFVESHAASTAEPASNVTTANSRHAHFTSARCTLPITLVIRFISPSRTAPTASG